MKGFSKLYTLSNFALFVLALFLISNMISQKLFEILHEKASRNALQTGSLFLAHAPETFRYLNPTVKEGAELCHQL